MTLKTMRSFREACFCSCVKGEAFIKRYNRFSWEKTANDRIDRPSFAERAVTEALVNALIHRDYLKLGSEVTIGIYDDRCEIVSPGDMYDFGELPEDPSVGLTASKRRNPVLADLFQRMGYMERRGSGLRKICEMTQIQDNFEPRFMPNFRVEQRSFWVTLWDMNYEQAPQAGEQETLQVSPQVSPQVTLQVARILEVLGDDEMSSREIMADLGLSDRASFQERYLTPALDAGVIERTIPDKPNSRLQKYRIARK